MSSDIVNCPIDQKLQVVEIGPFLSKHQSMHLSGEQSMHLVLRFPFLLLLLLVGPDNLAKASNLKIDASIHIPTVLCHN